MNLCKTMVAVMVMLTLTGCKSDDKANNVIKADKTMTQKDIKTDTENIAYKAVDKPAPLSEQEKYVIDHAGTESPFTGKYWNHFEDGHYVCRKCGTPLYKSSDKFESHCGWPSFDDEISGAVTRRIDADGRRTEIICSNCGGHLGHVFTGEKFTAKDTRHCVNSVSLQFVPAKEAQKNKYSKAYFAGGCFWGIEHFFEKLDGIKNINVGYTGGKTPNPSYKDVCSGKTGHAEAVEIEFDPHKISYEKLTKYFFEIHDPTQHMRQGNDVGSQYRSAIFFTDNGQKQIAERIISKLKSMGYDVKTEVTSLEKFYLAEDYHQDYLQKNPGGYCAHEYTQRFDRIELNK